MVRPDTEHTRAHWDEQAATYHEAKVRNAGYYDALKRLFAEAVGPRFRDRVLEVGCGTGEVLASLTPGQGVGLDLSPRMIEQARARFETTAGLRFLVADAAEAPDAGAYDAVISADVLEHVPAWRTVVEAMIVSCRPGGLIAISTPNPKWALPLWILEKCRLKMPEGPHEFVSARAIAEHLSRHGAQVERVSTHQLIPTTLGGMGPRLSSLAERTPILDALGVIQLVVARKLPLARPGAD